MCSFSNQYLRFPLKAEGMDFLLRGMGSHSFASSLLHMFWLVAKFEGIFSLFCFCLLLTLRLRVIYTKSWKDDLYSEGLQARLITPRSFINSVQRACPCPQPPPYFLLQKYSPNDAVRFPFVFVFFTEWMYNSSCLDRGEYKEYRKLF